ncbi:MAG TPA: hypothetical protein VG498_18910, partial [Terriglobales bacterium]|nr:hypothetical protein [Terriglobales bacterium]
MKCSRNGYRSLLLLTAVLMLAALADAQSTAPAPAAAPAPPPSAATAELKEAAGKAPSTADLQKG